MVQCDVSSATPVSATVDKVLDQFEDILGLIRGGIDLKFENRYKFMFVKTKAEAGIKLPGMWFVLE